MSYTPGRRAAHCAFCGARFTEQESWPRDCPSCGETTWANPLPVAVTLLPVTHDGTTSLVVVRRSIQPGYGLWALPGGYVELGETWQHAAVRELWEESAITAPASDVEVFGVDTAPLTMQVFGILPTRPLEQLPRSRPTAEAFEWSILTQPRQLAFDTHTTAVRRFFAQSMS